MDEDRYYNLGSHDKLFNQIDELTDALAGRDAEVAELRNDVKMLREFVKLLRDYIPASAVGNMTVQEALSATKRNDRS